MNTLGPDTLRICNGLGIGTSDSVESIIQKLDDYCIGTTNEIMEHFRFNMRDQRSDESFTEWLADLRAIAKTCSFNSIQKVEDTLLRNRIIHGIRDKKAQAKMLDRRGADLETVIDIARTCEATEHHLKTISQTSDVHAVNSDKSYKKNKRFTKRKPTTQPDNVKKCLFCMKEHVMRKESCPAWGKTCNTCKKTGHFKGSKMCKSGGKKHVHALYDESETDSSDTEELCGVESINNVQNTGKAVYCTMLVGEKCNESEVKFQIDCGATVNVLPLKHLTVSEKDKISNSQITLKMWNGSTINAVGKLAVRVRNPKSGGKYRAPFVIVDSDLTPLLSRKTAEQMGLITINYESFEHVHSLVTEHDQPFSAYPSTISDGLGDLPGLVKLVTDDAQPPEIKPARRVAVVLKPAVKKKLSDLEKIDVLAKVDEPTDWVSQMAVSTKRSGDLRICIDPQVLNKSLKREHFQLPVLEDILPDLAKAKIFSKLDLANGYWHCKLDEESSLKTTFSTPFGRYCWKRLPFGLTVSSEIFQKRLMTALDGLDGVLCVADDIMVWGSGDTQTDAIADHDVKLKNLLERCSKLNIKLNHSKCEIRKTEIAFLGHLVTNRGLLPDPEKIKAVLDLDKPTSVESIQQLNGFVNYLSKFMPHLSEIMEPIRRLTRKDEPWRWTEEQNKAVDSIKDAATKTPILAYYDPSKASVLQCDASQKGFGAVLLQEGRPVAYTSRALTDTEQRYAQIEKEALSVVFGLTKFHQYTFGRKTMVCNDHKPLEAIVKKPLHRAPKRLQGMLLRILEYDTEVRWKPGKDVPIADLLSRSYLPGVPDDEQEFAQVNTVSFLPIGEKRLCGLKQATDSDDVLCALKDTIMKGWPENKDRVSSVLMPYFHICDELCTQDGLVLRGERVVVPKSMRPDMMKTLHSSHLGIKQHIAPCTMFVLARHVSWNKVQNWNMWCMPWVWDQSD